MHVPYSVKVLGDGAQASAVIRTLRSEGQPETIVLRPQEDSDIHTRLASVLEAIEARRRVSPDGTVLD